MKHRLSILLSLFLMCSCSSSPQEKAHDLILGDWVVTKYWDGYKWKIPTSVTVWTFTQDVVWIQRESAEYSFDGDFLKIGFRTYKYNFKTNDILIIKDHYTYSYGYELTRDIR